MNSQPDGTLPVLAGPGGYTLAGAVAATAAAETTPQDLFHQSRSRTSAWEPGLGAWSAMIGFTAPEPGPLHGAVLAVKDHMAVAGMPNRAGAPEGAELPPETTSATIVSRLVDAGGTLAGITAFPSPGSPGGMTPQTGNPRAPDRIAGGSSGGSAAAVAAGLVHAALGSDSGGSIRIPASCCGVVSLNPTRGVVPLTGLKKGTYSIGSAGPIATNVADVATVFDVIAGFDGADPYSVAHLPPAQTWDPGRLRIGVPRQIMDTNIDDEVRAVWANTIDLLVAAGAIVVDVDLPGVTELPALLSYVVGLAESTAILEDRFAARPDLVNPGVVERLDVGRAIPATELARVYHRGAAFRARLREVFGGVDVFITPTLPCRVPSRGHDYTEVDIEVGGVIERRVTALTRMVNPWNMASVPAGSVPAGSDSDGGPIGVQVVGPAFEDRRVLDVMAMVETAVGGPWDTVPSPSER